ncbi:hypothetical protein G6F56_001886 [Rhizopus delemar]|nr:hypothetical protein G6F56_001886 [Rhizopus delemar]
MRKNEQNRKRSRSESRGIEAKEDLNYEDEESELSSGDLSSSDLDLSYDYNAHIPKKRSKRKAREGSHSYAPPPKGYVSDIDETGEEKIDKYGELLGDPAALLGYRDSFIFMKRNTSLIKAQLTNEERGFLVDSGLLRSSFRTRDISVVTARSVYKRFGYRIVRKGRKGKDDYFYTEEQEAPVVESVPENPNGHGINYNSVATNTHATNFSTMNGAHVASAFNNNVQTLPPAYVGRNSLQFEQPNQDVNGRNYLHYAAVTARQFNSSLFLYRRSNSTNYDMLTNVYQIPKTKQVFTESTSTIKKDLDSNTQKNPSIQ